MPGRGSEGGRATFERHGSEHMAEIGRKGFTSFTCKYFAGDREAAMEWLRRRAYEREAETHAERELNRRLAKGDKVASVEIPVVTTEDDGIPF